MAKSKQHPDKNSPDQEKMAAALRIGAPPRRHSLLLGLAGISLVVWLALLAYLAALAYREQTIYAHSAPPAHASP